MVWTNLSITQSISQSINQSVNQSINQPTTAILQSVDGVDKLLKEYKDRKGEEESRKRRLCGLQTIMADDPDVLGKVRYIDVSTSGLLEHSE